MASPADRFGESLQQRYRAVTGVVAAMASHQNPHDLLENVAARLRPVLGFTFLGVILHDTADKVTHSWWLDGAGKSNVPPGLTGEDSPFEWVQRNQQLLVVRNTFLEGRYPEAAAQFRRYGAGSAILLPLSTPHRRLGVLVIGHAEPNAPADTDFARLTADLIAAALDNALHHQEAAGAREQLEIERSRLGFLLDLNNRVATVRDLSELFHAVSAGIRRVMRCDSVALTLPAGDGRHLRVHALDFPDSNGYFEEHMLVPIDGSLSGEAFRKGHSVVVAEPDPNRLAPNMYRTIVGEGIHTVGVAPLMVGTRAVGTIVLGRREPAGFSGGDLEFITSIADQVALAVDNASEFRRLADVRERKASEAFNQYDPIRNENLSDEIVGTSRLLWHVLEQVKAVAPTDAPVLLIGESGTGKELLARAIHDLSGRAGSRFIRAHCAGTPEKVLESELFGQEKDAFAAGLSRKLGRVEMADQGTLFLDEVGELPMDLQLEVLRLSTDGEFERVGGTSPLNANVRLVAATSRDLQRLVDERRFRLDLFYRLNLFPIVVPPLRQRPEDIPLLVRHFVARYTARFQRSIETIPDAAMRAMSRYPWPGNVRELRNFVERSVILSSGPVLAAPLTELRRVVTRSLETDRTLAEIERDGIIKALRESDWRVGGINGAASRLGVPRTTLIYKMRKLRISRDRV